MQIVPNPKSAALELFNLLQYLQVTDAIGNINGMPTRHHIYLGTTRRDGVQYAGQCASLYEGGHQYDARSILFKQP